VKNEEFRNNISDYSLKLQIMYYMTKRNNNDWNWPLPEELRNYCINMLKKEIEKNKEH
jgi:hypothetical protein